MQAPARMMIKKLRYFLALVDELHYTNAANRVGTDSSTFSRKIKDLEKELGIRLFQRDNRGTRDATPAGKAFAPFARLTVTHFDQGLTAARDASPDRARIPHRCLRRCADVAGD